MAVLFLSLSHSHIFMMSGTSTPTNSRHSSPLSHQHRKTVLVEDTFLQAKPPIPSEPFHHSCSPSLNGKAGESKATSSPERKVSDGLPLSPAGSYRSERSSGGSSLLDTVSNVSGLVISPSSDHKILEELTKQISMSAARIRHLEKEAERIPTLSNQVEDLQKERGRLANELLDQTEVLELLKQRVSMLHEQNGQLAKLVQVEKGGSGEVLSMRNTLMASLTQLKRLQEQVNAGVSLKKQVSRLMEENSQLKEREVAITRQFPVELPKEVNLIDYKTLWDENAELKSTNQKLTDEILVVQQHISTVSASFNGLKKRIELFETSQVQTTFHQERIKRLEADKADLSEEVIDLKLKYHHTASPADIDTAQLRKDVASLQKMNAKLISRLEQMRIDTRQQKEQLVLKLFEFEAMTLKTHKYELEKEAVQLETHVQPEMRHQFRSDTQSPDLDVSIEDVDAEVLQDAPPELKMQLVNLHQLKVHSEQSRNLVQGLLSDREELERKMSEMNSKLQESGVAEIEKQLENTSSTLDFARKRISTLETELQAAIGANSSQSSLAIENEGLKSQLAQLQAEHQQCTKLAQSLKQTEGKLHDQVSQTQSLRKTEKKLKESKEKLRSLAKQLSGSVELVKNYQLQCERLDKELAQSKKEEESLREQHSSLKARMEVAKVEGTNVASENNNEILVVELASLQQKYDEQKSKDESELSRLKVELSAASTEMARLREHDLTQHKSLYSEACQERDRLKQTAKELEDKISSLSLLQVQLHQATAEKEGLAIEVAELQQRVGEFTEKMSAVSLERSSLQSRLDAISSEAPVLVQRNVELQSERNKAEDEVKLRTTEKESLTQKVSELEEQLSSMEAEQQRKVAALEIEITTTKETAVKLQSEKENLKAQVDQQSVHVTELQGTVEEKEREIQSVRGELDSTRLKSDQLRYELNEKKEALKREVEAKRNLEDKMSRLTDSDMPNLQSELKAARGERDGLASILESRSDRILELEESLQEKSKQLVCLQQSSESASLELVRTEQALKESSEKIQSLEDKLHTLEHEHSQLQTEYRKASEEHESQLLSNIAEMTHMHQTLETSVAAIQSCPECAELRRKERVAHSHVSELEVRLEHREEELRQSLVDLHHQKKEFEQLKRRSQTLSDEVEGYRATIDSLTRNLDEAETMKMEYEILKQKIHKLEQDLRNSSQLKLDNRVLISMLHETVREIPSFTSETNKRLQEENLRLEQQVSVLSQWNDKQRVEIEALETRVDYLDGEKHQLLMDLMSKENFQQENQQLKQELKEVEMEVNTLRRQVRADLQEELQVRLETQSQLLSVFNTHNSSLQKQVVQLQDQIRVLGGTLEREKPVSPPPMPEVVMVGPFPEDSRTRTISDLEKENEILKQRIFKLEGQLAKVQDISATVRRRSSTLSAIFSVPIAPINEDVQVK